jgi:hypothetical protein
MSDTRPRKKAHRAPSVSPSRRTLIDLLEPRVLLAADSELRWMIAAAGATPAPSPALNVAENLADQNGYPRTTDPAALTLTMTASPEISSLRVNGVSASPGPALNGWMLANANNVMGLSPGINRVQVRGYDPSNTELTRKTVDIWYDDGNVQPVSGTLSGNNTWTAANGPYHVTADLTVPVGSSLTIEPGTSVYVAGATKIVINGRLNAVGTDFKHIRMTRVPTAANDWGDLEFRSTQQDNRMAFVDYEYARIQPSGSTIDQGLRVDKSKLFADHIHFDHIDRMYIDLNDASLELRHSIFPNISNAAELIHYLAAGGIMPAGSVNVLDGNVFGRSNGYNDIIDWTGGQRPGPTTQFLNNWFTGGSDDGLDLDSTDAWIEGNVFMNFHQDIANSSKSHAVSTGDDFDLPTEITVVRNFFYDVDHAAIIKDGAYATFVNNTIVNVYRKYTDVNSTSAVFNLYEARSGQFQGRGLRLEGNIIQNASQMFELPQPLPSGHPEPVDVFIDNSILPVGSGTTQAGANITFGAGVKFGDPMLANVTNVLDPTIDFALQPKSPAIGTGPFGRDMGALVPGGVILSGEPANLLTNNNDVTLNVGFLYGTGTNAAGYTHYKYRLNNGPWSAETPTTTPITLNDLPDGAYTVFAIGKNDTGAWQSESAPTASKTFTIDTTPPRVTSSVFHFETPVHSFVVGFSEPVEVSLLETDPTLTNLNTGAVIHGSDIQWTPGAPDHGATLTFPNLPDGRLPEGRYRLTLHAAGIHDHAGNPLDGDGNGAGGDDFPFPTFVKIGDLNRDGIVNFADLVILAQNYGGTAKSFAEGNLDYDPAGNVGFNDLVIVAQTYGTSLPAEASATNAPVIPSAKSRPPAPIFNAGPRVQPKKPIPRKRS